ncbi:hypothetical protein RISK_000900 [Rhodopirellula islandica]|uniref:Secreted protein containing DUF1571 n=1 Tax=Rhodopirellula islandica TaxID=595434 RepID=A0A0J1ENL7_RHOIS|nr:DUF1571 domain-containing protein [Rhodopirellula islandica]KLU07099.1 hypothetical protein RISK_000900 [Rhodopirellula islandica]
MPTPSLIHRLRSSSILASKLTLSCVLLGSMSNPVAVRADETASAVKHAGNDGRVNEGRVSVQKIAVEDPTDQLAKQAIAELGLDEQNIIEQMSATSPANAFSTNDSFAPLSEAKGTTGGLDDHRSTPPLADHPLSWALGFAQAHADHIRQHVSDYSCKLIKRERIDGDLQIPQIMDVAVRVEQANEQGEVSPMSVFLQYQSPRTLRDRRVLYIEGENEGKARVRKGGGALSYLVLSIDPHGRQAQEQSNYPITDIGFDKIMNRLIGLIEFDMENDPSGDNTEVTYFRNARVMGRPATHIQIVHPTQEGGVTFHRANAFIDDELHVPIRLEVYDWPASESDAPELKEEYTYADLKLNVGLADATFASTRLKGKLNGNVGLTEADLKVSPNAVAKD